MARKYTKKKVIKSKKTNISNSTTIDKVDEMSYTFFKDDKKVVIKARSQSEAIDKFNSMK
jgi:hypothetical protein